MAPLFWMRLCRFMGLLGVRRTAPCGGCGSREWAAQKAGARGPVLGLNGRRHGRYEGWGEKTSGGGSENDHKIIRTEKKTKEP